MLTLTSKKTLGALTIALLGFAPLASQAAFCPLGLLFPGGGGCENQDSCPTSQAPKADRNPFRKLLDQIDNRQGRQLEHIQQGVDSGLLSARDTQQLMREQCDIQRQRLQAMADGFLSPYEWAALENAQENAGQRIRNQKRDLDWRG